MSITGILFITIMLFQIIYGSISLKGNTRLSFFHVSILTISSNIVMSIIELIFISNEFDKNSLRCGTPFLSYFLFAIVSCIFLISIAGIQLVIRYLAKWPEN